jgi:ribosomal protein S18 acetylase RimI-like enzyme
MTPSTTIVRAARLTDAERMVEIMESNHHYYTPEVDGVEAIARQLKMPHNVILVAQQGDSVVGFVLGTWDGARAFLFKMSVHPNFQKRGIGTQLVKEAAKKFKTKGAVTIGLSAADGTGGDQNNAVAFWEKLGFEQIPARLMINFEIEKLLEG